MWEKLRDLERRYAEIGELLEIPDIYGDPAQLKKLTREQKELEAVRKEQDMTQQISDDNDTAIEQEILKNEPKMMQLRAEYQIMDSGVATIQYLTTNIPILIPAMMASIAL